MRTKKEISEDKIVTLIELSREIVDFKYGGLELSEEGKRKLEEMEERYNELKTELEVTDRYEEIIRDAEIYIRKARTKFIIGEIV